jgi:hypothetical protein
MHKWEFFLKADAEFDLSNAERARQWAGAHLVNAIRGAGEAVTVNVPMGFWAGRLLIHEPTADDAKRWERAVRAIRSLARRLKGAATRAPGITPREADEVMSEYCGALRVNLNAGQKPMQEATYTLRPFVPDLRAGFGADATAFLATIFASFLQPDSVCGSCGAPLPPTPKTGRPSRATRCAKCTQRYYWQETMSEEERREFWRKQKKKQRDKSKEE